MAAWTPQPETMHLRVPALICAVRPHGETGAIARLLTASHGLLAVYVAGGRGRQLRPVLIPGNGVEAEVRGRAGSQLPSARLELTVSRAPFLSEPLPAAAIAWVTALTASTLPEQHPYPPLHQALEALLEAICHAPSARGWAPLVLAYEVLLLRELGYGRQDTRPGERPALPDGSDWPAFLAMWDRIGTALARYPLAHGHGDVMGARALLRERLGRMAG